MFFLDRTQNLQGSLNGTHFEGIKQCKCMVILMDLNLLVVVSIICYFHPYFRKISNLTNIFFRWAETHQLDLNNALFALVI